MAASMVCYSTEQAFFLSAFAVGPVALAVAIANIRVLIGWLVDVGVAAVARRPLPTALDGFRAVCSIGITGAGFVMLTLL